MPPLPDRYFWSMKAVDIREELIKKYDVPVPRYTSYPTVPCWDTEKFSSTDWRNHVVRTYHESNRRKGISIYVHLPYCESLCTYCACNTRITRNHAVEQPYVLAVLDEWKRYLQLFGHAPVIRELHLGGGTPTFFSPDNLRYLVSELLKKAQLHPDREFSFEGHPNDTTPEHLSTLFDLGFTRVSFGVQDLDLQVQRAINRIQPFESVAKAVSDSRAVGYNSISFDLVYGLPYQTAETVSSTMAKVISLKPDRVAFYSYAHVPWLKPGQRGYEDADLPTDLFKRQLYETGKKLLEEAGYVNIGMDHFALPSDTLAKAAQSKRLHRNFMGYTTSATDLLIGLGASAISDAKYGYAQNEKQVDAYLKKISAGELAVVKGHTLTHQDMLLRQCIMDIATSGELSPGLLAKVIDYRMYQELCEMDSEGIIALTAGSLKVTELGKIFVRNICRVFDARMRNAQTNSTQFSRAI